MISVQAPPTIVELVERRFNEDPVQIVQQIATAVDPLGAKFGDIFINGVQTTENALPKQQPVIALRRAIGSTTTPGPTIPLLEMLLAQNPYYNPYRDAPRTYPINGEYRLMHTQPALGNDGKPLPNATDSTLCQTTSAVMGDGRAILFSANDNCKTQIQYAPLDQGTGNKTKAGNKTYLPDAPFNLEPKAGGVKSPSSVVPVEAEPDKVAISVNRKNTGGIKYTGWMKYAADRPFVRWTKEVTAVKKSSRTK